MPSTAKVGVHVHHLHESTDLVSTLNYLKNFNIESVRLDTNWAVAQNQPSIDVNTDALALSDAQFDSYMQGRGYTRDYGNTLSLVFNEMKAASDLDFGVIYNFGTIPEWSGEGYIPDDPQTVADHFFDLIVYFARQPGGLDVLSNIEGWQLFNEVNNHFDENNYVDYLNLVKAVQTRADEALDLVNQQYGTELKTDVIAPSLGGTFMPEFLQPAIDAGLEMDSIAIHTYGARADVWDFGAYEWPTGHNPTYHKRLRPTDDILTWRAAADRYEDDALVTYEDMGVPEADHVWDYNAEVGVSRTMALLYQNGYEDVSVNLTEWGANTLVTDPRATGNGDGFYLPNVNYLDPVEYGHSYLETLDHYTLMNQYAEQAKHFAQMLGLIETWDFINAATAFELYDQYDEDCDCYEYEVFGLYDLQGNWKPAAYVLYSYTAGAQFDDSVIANDQLFQFGEIDTNITIDAIGLDSTIVGGDTYDTLLGRDGDDNIDGGAGDDVIFGGDGTDVLEGGDGYDKLYGGFGNDQLSGGAGADKLTGGVGDDVLTGGAGRDHFSFSVYSTDGSGFDGHDVITDFNVQDDMLFIVGGHSAQKILENAVVEGDDTLLTLGRNGATVRLSGVTSGLSAANFYILDEDDTDPVDNDSGTSGDDLLRGTEGDDTLEGLEGNDILMASAGNDVLDGGAGFDTVSYMEQAQGVTVYLEQSELNDGAAQGDQLIDVESVTGTGFADLLVGDAQGNVLVGIEGDDVIIGQAGNDILAGGDGQDQLEGGVGNDVLYGGDGADILTGEDGIDVLYGEGGDDQLSGGADRDFLFGGTGNDVLIGGAGDDIFAHNAGDGVDRINDFEDGIDLIDLSGHSFTSIDQVLALASQTESGVNFQFTEDDALIVADVTLAELNAADIIL